MIRRSWDSIAGRALAVVALAASLVPLDAAVLGGPSASVAVAQTPPANVWGFDSVAVSVGDGSPGFGGDGGPATAASIREPADVAVSANAATWYVTDTWNNRIRAVDTASGTISTVAGSEGQCGRATDPDDGCGDGGQATDATLNRPHGVALSADGTVLYIADTSANLVRAVTLASGVISTLAGNGTEGFDGDGGPAASAQLAGPSGVVAAPDGSVYVADTFNNRVRHIASGGTITTFAGSANPCVDPSTACGDGGPATSANLNGPVGVALIDTPAAALVIADTGDNRIRTVGADGVINTVVGTGIGGDAGDTGQATAAQLNQPQRAVAGTGGAVFISDTGNQRIRVAFLVPGTIWPVAGTGSPASGPDHQPSWETALSSPSGLAVTSSGLAVADTANHVVRSMTVPHAVFSFASCGPNGATPDGRYSAEIPLGGLPTPKFLDVDVLGGAGGSSTSASQGSGGYAHQAWHVDPAGGRLFAAVGCQGESGAGDGQLPQGGGGGGASSIAAVTANGERPLVIAGGGGGASDAIPTCGNFGTGGNEAGIGAQAGGLGPGAGASGTGGVAGGNPGTTGANGYGGSGGPSGYGGGGGWGLSYDTAGAGNGGRGTSAGDSQATCLGTGGGGGGWGGGAGGPSSASQGGSGGGNYGQCTDATQGQTSLGDGSIVVEITVAASASCSPTLGPDATGATRDAAHARVWSAVHAIGDAQERHRSLPAPQNPRLAAASTVSVPFCPGVTLGTSQQPGDGQAVFFAASSPTGPSVLVDTGRWDESDCQVLSGEGSVGYVALGPGVVARTVNASGTVTWAATTGPVTMPGPFASGAVLEGPDALKLFNECPGCDLTDANLSDLTFPPGADLTNATLSGATIFNTDLSQVVLSGATFGVDDGGQPTVISDSSLQGATFTGTVFDQTVLRAAGFEQASFTCASFTDTVLLEASFADATWSSPSCSQPTFQHSVLRMSTVTPAAWGDVSFAASTIVVDAATQALAKGITLPSWSFIDSQFVGLPPDLSGLTVDGAATLDGSSFMLADLTSSSFKGTTSMQRTVFVDATMDNSKLPDAVAHGAVFTGASLGGAVFSGAKLGAGPNPDAPLPIASFRNADAHGADFSDVEAQDVAFDGAYLYPGDDVVTFDGAHLDGATFTGAVLGQTDFDNIDADTVGFAGAQCINCDFTGATMPGAHFDSAYIYGASFAGAAMSNASFVNAACCATGTWTYTLGTNAAATPQSYAVGSAPSLSGPEFDDISSCPSGQQPATPGGCTGQTVPGVPPPQPLCAAAADHNCPLDITLVGGNGTAGYSDGGPQRDAALAAFNSPADVAYDPTTGDAIVADTANRVVRRIAQVSSPAPTVSIVAGTPPAAGTPAPTGAPPKRTRPRPGVPGATPTLIAPSGVALSTVGSVATIGVADEVSHIVFTTTGMNTPRPLAGTGAACAAPTDGCGDGGPATRAELRAPQGIWFDPTGNLYVADTGDNRIRRVDTTGTITTVAGTGQSGDTGDNGSARTAQLAGPTDVVGDRLGNLYVADTGNGRIRRIDPAGNITTFHGGLTSPTSITVDGRNRLYVVETGANVIKTLNVFGFAQPLAGTGTAGYSGDGGPAATAQLNGPRGVAAIGDEAVFVADTANQRIRIIEPPS